MARSRSAKGHYLNNFGSTWCYISRLKAIAQLVPKKIYKGFYHTWAWRPCWSCDLKCLNIKFDYNWPSGFGVVWNCHTMRVLGQRSKTLISCSTCTHKFSCTHQNNCIRSFSPRSSKLSMKSHMFQHFLIFDLAIKKINKRSSFVNLGSSWVSSYIPVDKVSRKWIHGFCTCIQEGFFF